MSEPVVNTTAPHPSSPPRKKSSALTIIIVLLVGFVVLSIGCVGVVIVLPAIFLMKGVESIANQPMIAPAPVVTAEPRLLPLPEPMLQPAPDSPVAPGPNADLS